MGSGRIVQVIGAVIDVEFPRDEVPQVYHALIVDGNGLTLEVQQQLGDGIVRTIAMGSSEGVARGLGVSNTEEPISVPVGEATLGRIMDVLGRPIDEKARSVKPCACQFTANHRLMTNRLVVATCWKLALRSLT